MTTETTNDFKTKYEALPEGKKAAVLRKFKAAYGSAATFYRKLNKQVRVRKIEEIFFINNL